DSTRSSRSKYALCSTAHAAAASAAALAFAKQVERNCFLAASTASRSARSSRATARSKTMRSTLCAGSATDVARGTARRAIGPSSSWNSFFKTTSTLISGFFLTRGSYALPLRREILGSSGCSCATAAPSRTGGSWDGTSVMFSVDDTVTLLVRASRTCWTLVPRSARRRGGWRGGHRCASPCSGAGVYGRRRGRDGVERGGGGPWVP